MESIKETAGKSEEKGKTKGKGNIKGKPKGKNGPWVQSKGGRNSTQVNDESTRCEYTSYTSREKDRGVLGKQEEWGRQRWNDDGGWHWGDRERKYFWIVDKPESSPCGDVRRLVGGNESNLLGFGAYYGWGYGEILPGEPNYVSYICSESEDLWGEQNEFDDWAKRNGRCIEKEERPSSSPRK